MERLPHRLGARAFLIAAAAALAGCVAVPRQQVTTEKWSMGYSTQALQAMQTTFGTTALRPGTYLWRTKVPTSGTTSIVVDLASQRAYVYRAGELAGVSSISSGRVGKETPAGIFSILEKKPMYHSKKYDNAPMPWMERIDEYGDALHGGYLPGYPDSHGCVRLPEPFARRLYELTEIGSQVVIED